MWNEIVCSILQYVLHCLLSKYQRIIAMMSNIFLLVLLGALLQSSYSLSPSKNFLASRMTRKFLSSLQSSLDATASKNLILSPDSSISRLELSESILKVTRDMVVYFYLLIDLWISLHSWKKVNPLKIPLRRHCWMECGRSLTQQELRLLA